jgi:hypothetical protein
MRAFPLLASVLLALAAPGSAVVVTLDQNGSPTITADHSVACEAQTGTADNTYYRSFALSDFGIGDDFTVSRVDFGVEEASSPGDSQSLTLTLYEGTSLAPLGAVVASDTFDIADQSSTHLSHAISGLVPFDSGGLVVALFSPGAGNTFLIGSNAASESAPGYLEAPSCQLEEPTAFFTFAPNTSILISVTGETVPEPARWVLLPCGAGALLLSQPILRSVVRSRIERTRGPGAPG